MIVPAVPSVDALLARLTDTQPVMLLVCAWHVPRVELDALSRRYPGQITHGLCPTCAAQLEAVATDTPVHPASAESSL